MRQRGKEGGRKGRAGGARTARQRLFLDIVCCAWDHSYARHPATPPLPIKLPLVAFLKRDSYIGINSRMAEGNRSLPEGRRSGETFALIRDAFVQAGRLLGRPGSSERQLSMHITDGRLQIVVSQQDDAKCSSGAASAIASALVHTHRVCRTASVVADVEVRAWPLAVRSPSRLAAHATALMQHNALAAFRAGWNGDHRASDIDLAHDSNPSTPAANRAPPGQHHPGA